MPRARSLAVTTLAMAAFGLALTAPAVALEVGDKAPDFTLPGPGNKPCQALRADGKGAGGPLHVLPGLHRHLNEGDPRLRNRCFPSSKPRAPRSWA